MPKKEKIKVGDLEKLGIGKKFPSRTESDFMEILGDKERLKQVVEKEGLVFFTELFMLLKESKDFRSRVEDLVKQKKTTA